MRTTRLGSRIAERNASSYKKRALRTLIFKSILGTLIGNKIPGNRQPYFVVHLEANMGLMLCESRYAFMRTQSNGL